MSRSGTALALVAALLWTGNVEHGAAATSWRDLHRPLHLPQLDAGEPCPISPVDPRVDWERTGIFGGSGIGRGPAYPGLGGGDGYFYANEPVDGWYGGKVFWYVKPTYLGRVLVRGRRLDAPGALRFSERRTHRRELRIGPRDSVSWSGRPPDSRGVPSGLWIRAAGCYAVQIDGSRFSRTVVMGGSISE